MTTKQPADQDIDFSDAPEITDFSQKERGKFHPRRLELEAEVRRLREDARALYAALRRLTDGMHTGDHEDARAALAAASALVGHLGERYEPDRF